MPTGGPETGDASLVLSLLDPQVDPGGIPVGKLAYALDLLAEPNPDLDAIHDHVAAASQIARGRYDILATASQVPSASRHDVLRFAKCQLPNFRQRDHRAHTDGCHAPPWT